MIHMAIDTINDILELKITNYDGKLITIKEGLKAFLVGKIDNPQDYNPYDCPRNRLFNLKKEVVQTLYKSGVVNDGRSLDANKVIYKCIDSLFDASIGGRWYMIFLGKSFVEDYIPWYREKKNGR